MLGARDLNFLAGQVSSFTCGRTPLAVPPTTLGVHHHEGGQTGHFVDLLERRYALLTFSNFTIPAYSVMIGRVCGSQVAS